MLFLSGDLPSNVKIRKAERRIQEDVRLVMFRAFFSFFPSNHFINK